MHKLWGIHTKIQDWIIFRQSHNVFVGWEFFCFASNHCVGIPSIITIFFFFFWVISFRVDYERIDKCFPIWEVAFIKLVYHCILLIVCTNQIMVHWKDWIVLACWLQFEWNVYLILFLWDRQGRIRLFLWIIDVMVR